MSVIDNRVVEMQFDNSNFENNVKTSMDTLDKLKESLNFSGVSDSFDNISDAAGKVNMSGLGSAVDAVANQFSALELVAISVLANIANKAVDAGLQLIESMSVDQISAGWDKFAENTKNIGTLVAQGFDLETVEEQMERLLWFTDETSYNYTDMVNSIGKFTATGQGLEDSVDAMEGIATWAAVSGANATKASSAMDVLSKAMSTGYMNLGYYRSIQNLSMDTTEFRQECLDAAVACGTLTDNLDGTYTAVKNGGTFDISGFTNELTNGAWLTSEVLMDVFADYSSAVDDIYTYAEENGMTASAAIDEIGDSVDQFGLKAFLAGQQAMSWGDAVDSVKDAASTGWMEIFTDIFGDYEEATELWTDLSEAMYGVFVDGINDTVEVLDEWHELGGRTILLDAFWTAWENVGEIVNTVKDAFQDVFPSTTVESLMDFTQGLKDFADGLKMSKDNLDNLHSTMDGLFSIIDIGVQFVSALFNGFVTLVKGLAPVGDGILTVTGSIGDLIYGLDQSIKESDIFNEVIQKIANFLVDAINAVIDFGKAIAEWLQFPDLDTIVSAVKEFIDTVKEKFAIPGFDALKEIFETIIEKVGDCLSSIFGFRDSTTEAFDEMGNKISNSTFFTVLTAIWNAVKKVAEAISSVLGDAIKGIADAIGNMNLEKFFDVLNDIFTGGVLLGIIDLVNTLSDAFSGVTGNISGLTDSVVGVLDSFGEVLTSWSLNIKADALLKIAAAIGILTIALIALTGIDSDALATAMTSITGLFVELVAAMGAFQALCGTSSDSIQGAVTGFIDAFSNQKQYTNLIKMAAAIGILAVALKMLADTDDDNLASAFAAITGLFVDLTAAMVVLSNSSGTSTTSLTSMIGMAAAIDILASACKKLDELEPDKMVETVAAVAVLTETMVLAFKQLSSNEKVFTVGGAAMIEFGAAIEILALACKTLGSMDIDQLIVSVAGVATLTATMVIAFKTLSGEESTFVTAGSTMLAFSAAIEVLALAAKTLGSMDLDQLIAGVAAVATITATMVIAFKSLSSEYETFVVGGSSMIAFAAAIEVLATACKTIGNMDLPNIVEGVAAIGVIAAEMVVALKALAGIGDDSSRLVAASSSMILMATAILILTPALKALGNMSLGSIATALIALAGAFVIIGGAASLLSGLSVTILELSASFTLLGVGVLAVGTGLTAAGVGIASLSASLAVGSAAIISAIKEIAVGIIELIPDIIVAIGQGIVDVCQVIADGAPTIAEAAKAIILSLVDILKECVPEIAAGACEMLLGVVEAMVEYAPSIVEALMQMISGIIDSIANNIPEIIESIMNLIGVLFSAVIDALNGLDTENLIEGIAAVGLLSALVVALSAISALIPAAMVALAELGAMVAEMAVVFAAIGALAQIPGMTWLIDEGAGLLEGIGNAIGGFVGGIVGGFLGGVSDSFPKIGSDLSEFMNNVQPFIEGASKIDSSVTDGVASLAEVVLLLTAADILNGLTSWLTGGSSIVGFGQELAEFGPYFEEYYKSVENINGDVVQASANAALSLAEMAEKLPNSGGLAGKIFGESSLSEFAEELVEFGPKLATYAASVEGINGDDVQASADAALVLAEMADKLPNSGGLAAKIFGDNSLADFANELVLFGPSLAIYTASVKGISSDDVQASADSAMILAEMADNLPNSGGLAEKIFGGNSLSDFGKELAEFGPYLASYADSVSGINGDVVTASANAAMALSALANDLPDSGGFFSSLFGDNGLEGFGKQLVSFGESFAEYATTVSGINISQLDGVVEEFSKLVDLANGLAGIDTGTLSTFAQDFKNLGNSGIEEFISAFTESSSRVTQAATEMISYFVEGVNSKQNEVSSAFATIVSTALNELSTKQSEFNSTGVALMQNLVTGITNQSSSATGAFTTIITSCITTITNQYSKFQSTGSDTLNQFITGVKSKESETKNTYSTIVTNCLTKIKDYFTQFKSVGTETMTQFISGVKSKDQATRDAFSNIISACLTVLRNFFSDFNRIGVSFMEQIIGGINSKSGDLNQACTTVVSAAASAIQDCYQQFVTAGERLGQGLADGVLNKQSEAVKAVNKVANAMLDEYDRVTDSHSPSREAFKRGANWDIGLANGIESDSDLVYDASSGVAEEALAGLSGVFAALSDFIDEEIDTEPTIRPVLDLSNVADGVATLSTIFGNNTAMAVGYAMNTRGNGAEIQNGTENAGNSYVFTQNNYSPKSLSRTEIYRQTKNQFSALERMVEGA